MTTRPRPSPPLVAIEGASPRRPVPLPARLQGIQPYNSGGSPSRFTLLPPMAAPPSPALSTTSSFGALQDSPELTGCERFHFQAHYDNAASGSEASLLGLPGVESEKDMQFPPTPQSFNGGEFDVEFDAAVEHDQEEERRLPLQYGQPLQSVSRLPPPPSRAPPPAPVSRHRHTLSADDKENEYDATVFQGSQADRSYRPPTSMFKPTKSITAELLPSPPLESTATAPPSWERKFSNASSESNESTQSWRDHLDRAVVEITANDELDRDDRISPETDAARRMRSILGPKMKILSPAPWDAEGEDSNSIHSATSTATNTTALPLHNSESSSRLPSLVKSASSSSSNTKPKKKLSVRTKSFSALKKSRSDVVGNDGEEGLKGLGLGIGLATSPTSPSDGGRFKKYTESTVLPPSSTNGGGGMLGHRKGTAVSPRSAATPFAFPSSTTMGSRPTRPVTGVSMISDPIPGTMSISSLSAGLPGSGSTMSLASLTAGPNGSGTGEGAGTAMGSAGNPIGYKLISLDEARAREVKRAAEALEKRKAMFPVEHIVGKQQKEEVILISPESPTVDSPTFVNASSSSSFAIPISPTSAPASPKTLTKRKSGFLKRMMGQEKVPSRPSPLPPPMPSAVVVEPSFRALPDDYVYDPTRPIPGASAISTSYPVPTSASIPVGSGGGCGGKVSFHSAQATDSEGRKRKQGGVGAPSLSLRPISMAFSAGLPTDFLATQHPLPIPPSSRFKGGDEDEDDDTPLSALSPTVSTLATTNFSRPSPPKIKAKDAALLSDSATLPKTETSALASPVAIGVAASSPSLPSPTTSPAFPTMHHSSPTTLDSFAPGPSSPSATTGTQRDDFAKAQLAWNLEKDGMQKQIRDLEKQVAVLRMYGGLAGQAVSYQCEHCGCPTTTSGPFSPSPVSTSSRDGVDGGGLPMTHNDTKSVLTRPRPVPQNSATGSLFGSGLAI